MHRDTTIILFSKWQRYFLQRNLEMASPSVKDVKSIHLFVQMALAMRCTSVI